MACYGMFKSQNFVLSLYIHEHLWSRMHVASGIWYKPAIFEGLHRQVVFRHCVSGNISTVAV